MIQNNIHNYFIIIMWYSVGLGHPHNATKQLVCWDLKARINLEVPNMCGCCSPRELLDSLTCDKATHASKKQRLEPDNADLYVVFLQLQNTVPTSISIESLCRTAFKCGLLQRSLLYIIIIYYLSLSITEIRCFFPDGDFRWKILPLPIKLGPGIPMGSPWDPRPSSKVLWPCCGSRGPAPGLWPPGWSPANGGEMVDERWMNGPQLLEMTWNHEMTWNDQFSKPTADRRIGCPTSMMRPIMSWP